MISVLIEREYEGYAFDQDRLARLAESVCERFKIADAEISVAIVGDERMTVVNNQFLKHDYTTDVISFNLSDEGNEGCIFEMIVNGEYAVREACERGHGADAELALYVVHGLLHNIGYDDGSEEDSAEMHRLEDEILQEAGFGRVYDRS